MNWQPTQAQSDGADFMLRTLTPLIFDRPGAGKTPMTILACDRGDIRHVLVICPASVRNHWVREFAAKQSIHREVSLADKSMSTPIKGVTVVSHDFVSRLENVEWLILGSPWDLIVMDESHGFASIGSKRTLLILGWHASALWKHTRRLWPLSGTPVVNSAADLYPLIQSVLWRSTGYAPPWLDFCERFTYLRSDERGGQIPTGVRNVDQLRALVRPFILRRPIATDLPDLSVLTHALPVDDRHVISAMGGLSPDVDVRLLEMQLDAGITPGEDTSVSRVWHATGIAKAPAVAQWLADRPDRLPHIVFYAHVFVRDALEKFFISTNFRVESVQGSDIPRIRQRVIDDFQAGKVDVLLVQERAGGTGLTLTASNSPTIGEIPWTTVTLSQEIARCHRRTQTRDVNAAILYGEGCWLEGIMQRVLARKEKTAWDILDA